MGCASWGGWGGGWYIKVVRLVKGVVQGTRYVITVPVGVIDFCVLGVRIPG